VKIWKFPLGEAFDRLEGHGQRINSVAYSPSGKQIVTGSEDRTARIWDRETRRQLLKIQAPGGEVVSVAFSPDGRRVATASGDYYPYNLKAYDSKQYSGAIWDAVTGELLFGMVPVDKNLTNILIHGIAYLIHGIAYSPDGKWLVTAEGSTTRTSSTPGSGYVVRNSSDGTPIHRVQSGSAQGLFGGIIAFSPDSRRVLTMFKDHQRAVVSDVASGRELLILGGPRNYNVACGEFSRDGKRILTGNGNGTAMVWDATTGSELLSLHGHTGLIKSAIFSPDDRRIITISVDGTVKIWDAKTGREFLTLDAGGWGMAVSPDGLEIVAGRYIWSAAPPTSTTQTSGLFSR